MDRGCTCRFCESKCARRLDLECCHISRAQCTRRWRRTSECRPYDHRSNRRSRTRPRAREARRACGPGKMVATPTNSGDKPARGSSAPSPRADREHTCTALGRGSPFLLRAAQRDQLRTCPNMPQQAPPRRSHKSHATSTASGVISITLLYASVQLPARPRLAQTWLREDLTVSSFRLLFFSSRRSLAGVGLLTHRVAQRPQPRAQ